MKLYPKSVPVCPGCPKDDLRFEHRNTFNIVPPKKDDPKVTTLVGKGTQTKKGGLF